MEACPWMQLLRSVSQSCRGRGAGYIGSGACQSGSWCIGRDQLQFIDPGRENEKQLNSGAKHDSYRWMFFVAGPLEQAVSVNAMGWEISDEQSRTLGFGTVAATLDAVEIALREGPFICGDAFTAVDVYLGSALNWGMMFGTLEKRESFQAYVGELVKRPALLRAQQLNEARMAETGSHS